MDIELKEHDNVRRAKRPVTPMPALRVKIDLILDSMAEKPIFAWASRIIVILIITAMSGVVWFEINDRLPILQKSASLSKSMALYEKKHREIEQKLSAIEVGHLHKVLKNRNQLFFQSEKEVILWLVKLIHSADKKNMRLTYRIGSTSAAPPHIGHYIVAVSLQLSSLSGKGEDVFKSMIKFVMTSLVNSKHIDLTSLTVNGDKKGVQHMSIIISVWLL